MEFRYRKGPGRTPMVNLLWGGVETNRIGTREFVEFCRRVGATPFFCVNFASDGRMQWANPPCGGDRSAGPEEAAAWVKYCNDPSNELRRSHGIEEPYGLKLWQLGNETSYDRSGFDCETAARKTVEFAEAMRAADPQLELIGWGDSGWAPRMLDIAGEHLQYIAFHDHPNPGQTPAAEVLRDPDFRKDPALTWECLMDVWRQHDERIRCVRDETAGHDVKLALSECHFSLEGRNRCDVLGTWASGVANARILNCHERHGDVLKIATLADFCGTRWMVNAVMIPTPAGNAYLMPVARIMQVYRKHSGSQFVESTSPTSDLDVTASRSGERVFLHVVNTNRTSSVTTRIGVAGHAVSSGEVFEIAPGPEWEIVPRNALELVPSEKTLPESCEWTFPPASVSAIDLKVSESA